MTDPQKDEHIEELLSKLQGIFGKLSHSEEEEAKQTIEIPSEAPKEPEIKETPPATEHISKKDQFGQPLHPEGMGKPPSATPAPLNLYSDPQTKEAPPTAGIPTPPGAASANGSYETMVPTEDPERIIVPTAIYFPPGKENEARSLAQKLETMAPKFTKVAFRLRIIVFLPYDPKSEWKEVVHAKAEETHFQTVFVAVERPMDDAKKKAIAAELEGKNIYFQEVPFSSIEKKAFYTDILLGLVFFFDSRKPPSNPEGSAS